jgi:hypothetical protein
VGALGGFTARRWEAIRERRAGLLLEEVPPLREALERPNWAKLLWPEHYLEPLHHKAIACSRRDARRVAKLQDECAKLLVRVQDVDGRLAPISAADRADRTPAFGTGYVDPAHQPALDAHAQRQAERKAQRQPLIEEREALRAECSVAVGAYVEWLKRRLTRLP